MTAEDLQSFCINDKHNWACDEIGRPWTRDGFTWATDRRIIVRVPPIDGINDNTSAPNAMKSVWRMFEEKADFEPLPELPAPIMEECEECKGGTVAPEGCSTPSECYECEGDAKWEKVAPLSLGERVFSSVLLRKISTLPGVEIVVDGEWSEPLSFRFDGGCGLLMPMRGKKNGGIYAADDPDPVELQRKQSAL